MSFDRTGNIEKREDAVLTELSNMRPMFSPWYSYNIQIPWIVIMLSLSSVGVLAPK